MPETKLRLSEAMRLGAMLAPQGFGTFRNRIGATCALGAVAEAIGGIEHLRLVYPILDRRAEYPVADKAFYGGSSLFDTIVQLNDVHCWTRERIADWIEAEFEKEPEAATPVAVKQHSIEEEPVAV